MGVRSSLKLIDVPRYEALVDAIKRAYRDVLRGRYPIRDLALVSLLAFTGCRLGEALRIRAYDLDFRRKVVRIHQEKKRRVFVRFVPVPSRIFWDVMGLYLRNVLTKDSLLFSIGDRQARNVVYKFSLRYLGRRIRPHAFRHSYATFILRNLKDLETLRRLLGHSDYSVIKEYLNYTQEDLEMDLERIFRELE